VLAERQRFLEMDVVNAFGEDFVDEIAVELLIMFFVVVNFEDDWFTADGDLFEIVKLDEKLTI
jgi:hypothetical protein